MKRLSFVWACPPSRPAALPKAENGGEVPDAREVNRSPTMVIWLGRGSAEEAHVAREDQSA